MHAETKSKSPLWIGLGPQGLLATVVIGSAVLVPLLLNPAGSELWSMLLLVGATAVYVGFAIRNNHARLLGTLVQALAAAGLVVLAVVFDSQWVVAVGLVGHAVWDAFHLKRSQRYVPWWYAGACFYVDLIAAAFLLLK